MKQGWTLASRIISIYAAAMRECATIEYLFNIVRNRYYLEPKRSRDLRITWHNSAIIDSICNGSATA
jgi:hypothetical protein